MARLRKRTVAKSIVATKLDDVRYPRLTFTVPPEVAEALDLAWRHHENLDGSLCQNKSNYVADLVRRDVEQKRLKTKRPTKRPAE